MSKDKNDDFGLVYDPMPQKTAAQELRDTLDGIDERITNLQEQVRKLKIEASYFHSALAELAGRITTLENIVTGEDK